jgi:NAD(P)-dependent dehydrogenase (short-subunit alcohol dehydrogenase family)
LAGGALVGNKDEQAVQAFAASDLTGPLLLAEHVKPYMAADSTMALVTSIAAALPATPGLEKYAAVKGGIVKWCAEKFVPYSADGVHVMLIAMGPIWTEAGRGEHAQGFFQNLVKFILPLPEQFSNLILKDAMNHERVSYPGFMAKLGEYKNNVYAIRFGPFIRNAFLLVLALGAWVMKRKEKMDGKLLNKKYPNV